MSTKHESNKSLARLDSLIATARQNGWGIEKVTFYASLKGVSVMFLFPDEDTD